MFISFAAYLRKRFSSLSRLITSLQYDLVSQLDPQAEATFLNYGYAEPGDAPLPESAPSAYQARLYHHLASGVEWTGRHVLEVGCGRGGGADYLTRSFSPATYTGLDLSPRAIAFCQRHYKLPGLSFQTGNAEALPFPDETFDLVLNVESSLYYPRIEKFLAEVARVLRPGGYFLYTDLRYARELPRWQAQREQMPLTLLREENLTLQVRRALELDRSRMRALLRRLVPLPLRAAFEDFAGIPHHARLSATPDAPQPDERIYMMFVYRKG